MKEITKKEIAAQYDLNESTGIMEFEENRKVNHALNRATENLERLAVSTDIKINRKNIIDEAYALLNK